MFLTGSIVYTSDRAGIGRQLWAISSISVIILSISLFGVYIYKMYSIAKTSKMRIY